MTGHTNHKDAEESKEERELVDADSLVLLMLCSYY